MYKKIYLRKEVNANEHRTPLVPRDVSKLVENGFTVYIESSTTRIYIDNDYKSVGAKIVNPDDYDNFNFQDIAIIGLKTPLHFLNNQTHIYFSHCFKEQTDSTEILKKLYENNIQLYDLEYFTNDFGKRLFAFGHYAGLIGGGIGLMQYFKKKTKKCNLQKLSPYKSKDHLFDNISHTLYSIDYKNINIAIIGAGGRCGQGVQQILTHFYIKYDILNRSDEKQNLGKYDIIYNCILLDSHFDETWIIPLDDKIQRVLVDVSCDCNNPYHPFNHIYKETTSWDTPVLNKGSLDIIAIDNLPSLIPRESSDAFSEVFSNFINENVITENNPWKNAYNAYLKVIQNGNLQYK